LVAEPQYYEFDNIIQFVTYELSTGPGIIKKLGETFRLITSQHVFK